MVISRGPTEIHNPIDVMCNASEHSRIREGTHRTIAEADRSMRILRNVQECLPEGSAPLSERFGRLLQSI